MNTIGSKPVTEGMQVVILCGGKGTRLKEHTENVPKPLIEIGGRPILWHLMKIYSHFGLNDFVLCLGHLGEKIKEFFLSYDDWRRSDFLVKMGEQREDKIQRLVPNPERWNITFAETGEDTNTGGRIKRVERYIHGDCFLATYADGLANIDLHSLLQFHRSTGKLGTITVLNPISNYGILSFDKSNIITRFREKPRLRIWVNGGFFVFERGIFAHLNDNSVLEQDLFGELARKRQLGAFQHRGFWRSMDTYKDAQELNRLWSDGDAPWKVWRT